MEGLRNKASSSGTTDKPVVQGRKGKDNSGAWNTWNGSSHLSAKGGKIKAEAIPEHMHKGKTETKHPKNKGDTTKVLVHLVHMN